MLAVRSVAYSGTCHTCCLSTTANCRTLCDDDETYVQALKEPLMPGSS